MIDTINLRVEHLKAETTYFKVVGIDSKLSSWVREVDNLLDKGCILTSLSEEEFKAVPYVDYRLN